VMSIAVEHERFILTANQIRGHDFISIWDKSKCPTPFIPSGGNS